MHELPEISWVYICAPSFFVEGNERYEQNIFNEHTIECTVIEKYHAVLVWKGKFLGNQ